MKKIYRIFGIFILFVGCILNGAPATKTNKSKLDLEINGTIDAKKLYQFLESNKGNIVELNVAFPIGSFDTKRIFFYEDENARANNQVVCVTKKKIFKDSFYETIVIDDNEGYMPGACKDEHKTIIEHHIGKNILSSAIKKDKKEMDEKWKKANNDIVVVGEGYFDGAEGDISEYNIKNGYIAFEDYIGNNKTNFYSIVVNGDGNISSYGLNGLFLVRSVGGEMFQYLDMTGDMVYCEPECNGEPNTHGIYIEPIDAEKYGAIVKYFSK